jgi:lysophospholipase L1-like esterase
MQQNPFLKKIVKIVLFKRLLMATLVFIFSILTLDIGLRLVFFIKDEAEQIKVRRHSLDPIKESAQLYKKISGNYQAWVDDLLIEMENAHCPEFQPFIIWRNKEFHGKYLNISSAGLRKTWNINKKGKDIKKIFCFGGSGLWGVIARDDYTIPSLLSQELVKSGFKSYYVENFGEKGYTFMQEIIQLILRLKEGDIPDDVIFYDGVNEVLAIYQPGGEVGGIQHLADLRHKFSKKEISDLEMFARGLRALLEDKSGIIRVVKLIRNNTKRWKERKSKRTYGQTSEKEINALCDRVVNKYLESISLVENLARIYGFRYKFFWQPNLFYARPSIPLELKLDCYKDNGGRLAVLLKKTYCLIAAKEDLPKEFVNISDIFSDMPQPLYTDFCHITEEANQIVAKRIFEAIKKDL